MELDEYINNILDMINKNTNLTKLLYFKDDKPLNNTDEVPNLIFKQIYPYPFSVSINDEVENYLFIFLDSFEENGNSFEDGMINFDILCHNELWHISGGLRPFRILKEIKNTFNKTANVGGIGRLQYKRARLITASNKYTGYRVSFKILDTQIHI